MLRNRRGVATASAARCARSVHRIAESSLHQFCMPLCSECGVTCTSSANFCTFCGAPQKPSGWLPFARRKYNLVQGHKATHWNSGDCLCGLVLFILMAVGVSLTAFSIANGNRQNSLLPPPPLPLPPLPWPPPLPPLPPPPTLQPLPPNTTTCSQWERLLARAQTCASDSEQDTWARCRHIDLIAALPRREKAAAAAPAAHQATHTATATAGQTEAAGQAAALSANMYRCADGHASSRHRSSSRTLLVGPFTSRAQEWMTIELSAPLLERGERVTRYAGGAVRAEDAETQIGYPPLHMHHVHVYSGLCNATFSASDPRQRLWPTAMPFSLIDVPLESLRRQTSSMALRRTLGCCATRSHMIAAHFVPVAPVCWP